jgi:hypothetical protein
LTRVEQRRHKPQARRCALSPTLDLAWTPGSDGSGLHAYLVEWASAGTDTQNLVQTTQYATQTRTSTFSPGEGQVVWAHVGSEDNVGQQSWQSAGPIYIDAPHTPDYVVLGYDGWQASGCSLVGVDRRIERSR